MRELIPHVKVPNLFIDNVFPYISPMASIVYIGFMYFVNEGYEGITFCSYQDVADLIGVSKSSVSKAVDELFSHNDGCGLIYRVKKGGLKNRFDLFYKPYEHKNNFTPVPIEVLASTDLTESAIKQYIYILRVYGDGKNGPAFPRRDTMARVIGKSVDTVKNNNKLLKQGGYCQIETIKRNTGDQPESKNLYTPLKKVFYSVDILE